MALNIPSHGYNKNSTRYVSHSRMTQCSGISRISKLFIHRNANCRYSMWCRSRCACSVANIIHSALIQCSNINKQMSYVHSATPNELQNQTRTFPLSVLQSKYPRLNTYKLHIFCIFLSRHFKYIQLKLCTCLPTNVGLQKTSSWGWTDYLKQITWGTEKKCVGCYCDYVASTGLAA